MSFTIRRAAPADLEAVLAIAAECPQAPSWKAAEYGSYLNAGSEGPLLRTAVGADAGESLTGFAAATLLLDGQLNRCEIESIAVLPSAREQGIGTALGEAVLSWAAEHGARRVTLEVRAGNGPAIRLYQRLGFVTEGLRARYYSDPPEDALLLGLTR